jgi:hypothetical protein
LLRADSCHFICRVENIERLVNAMVWDSIEWCEEGKTMRNKERKKKQRKRDMEKKHKRKKKVTA